MTSAHTPGQTRLSASTLGRWCALSSFPEVLAHRSRQAEASSLRGALAYSPSIGVETGWALGWAARRLRGGTGH